MDIFKFIAVELITIAILLGLILGTLLAVPSRLDRLIHYAAGDEAGDAGTPSQAGKSRPAAPT